MRLGLVAVDYRSPSRLNAPPHAHTHTPQEITSPCVLLCIGLSFDGWAPPQGDAEASKEVERVRQRYEDQVADLQRSLDSVQRLRDAELAQATDALRRATEDTHRAREQVWALGPGRGVLPV
jgi:hypothetical protein